MRLTILLSILLVAVCLMSAQDLTPWQYVRHSAVDNNGVVHVRFNGNPDILNAYQFLNWQNNAWTEQTLTNPEPLVYEALLPAAMGQTLKYRLRTSYEAIGESITAVNPAFLDSDAFPPALNALGYIADDPAGDSINVYHPNLDITGNWFGYTDTKLYCAVSNASNLFPAMNSFTSYNMYYAGLASSTSAVADSTFYAMIYTFNIPGVISPGLYKLGINPADTTVVYEYLTPIQTIVSGGKLFLSCNISDLTADPEFGNWPPEYNSLGFMSGSIRIEIDTSTLIPSFGIGDLSGIAQLIFENHSYTIGQNALPVISNSAITGPAGAHVLSFTYSDADGDFPLTAHHYLNDPGTAVNFIPSSLDFSQPVNMNAYIGSIEYEFQTMIRVSDNNMDFVTDWLFVSNEDEIQPPATAVKIYPNPFNPAAGLLNIEFSDDNKDVLTGGIYNLKGQCIRKLSGRKTLVWDGANEDQTQAGNGIYLFKANLSTGVVTGKLILIR